MRRCTCSSSSITSRHQQHDCARAGSVIEGDAAWSVHSARGLKWLEEHAKGVIVSAVRHSDVTSSGRGVLLIKQKVDACFRGNDDDRGGA